MLTDTACRLAQPGPKPRKLADAGGLLLLVSPTGHRSWRLKYRFAGKEKQLAIGPYPAVSLRQARDARDAAKQLLRMGVDPSAEKARRRAADRLVTLDSFEAVARAWHAAQLPTWNQRYAGQVLDRLQADVFPKFGRTSIRAVTPPIVLDAIRAIEARGSMEMARRVRMHVSEVFVFAIASGLAEQDPAATIRKALAPANPALRPALLQLKQCRAVLTAVERHPDTHRQTVLASRLLALTAARPGTVRQAEAREFEDLGGAEPLWRIPAAKLKLQRERKRDPAFAFVLPLSRQAAALVRHAIAVSPACQQVELPQWLFPGIAGWRRPISDSTLSKLYRLAGFAGRHVPHGWRASFSTVMNERAAREGRENDRPVIDLMLAHMPEGVEAAYNRAAFMPRRRELAQAWADLLLEGLPEVP